MREIPHLEQVGSLPLSVFSSEHVQQSREYVGEATIVRDVPQKPQYNELAVGTNISKAPRNWLTNDHRLVPYHNANLAKKAQYPTVELTTFGLLAEEEVDVIGPVDNIKKIFKIPYSKSRISLAVHKIGRTLVLDKLADEVLDEDLIHANNDRFTEILENDDKSDSKDSGITVNRLPKKKNREKVIENTLYSKFLYYTVLPNGSNKHPDYDGDTHTPAGPKSDQFPPLPKFFQSSKAFSRLIRWRFRDNAVLLGTNLIIFTSDNQPCVSLRLRDLDKQMSPLTTLDYWLDNIMANVPSVAICNHRGGYVQGYQLIKTEDLPSLHPSLTFQPALVEESANSVFKFLQSHCTQEAGTYWLYKDNGDDVLRLYNISNYRRQPKSSSSESTKKERPFALPVGMMCYTLANKILQNNKSSDARTRARALLDKCVEVLDETKYPSIWASAQEKIADTISNFDLPVLFHPTSISVSSAQQPVPYSSPRVNNSEALEEEQFVTAVHHLSKGISILTKSEDTPAHRQQIASMKSKAALCYYQLAKINMLKGKYGSTLHWLQLSSQSLASLPPQTPNETLFFGSICSLCADVYFGITTGVTEETLPQHQADLGFTNVEDPYAKSGATSSELIHITEPLILDAESNLRTAISYYMKALSFITPEVDQREYIFITRKLGNVQNQLGIHYMETCRFTKAAWHFHLGVDIFKQIQDHANIALLYCNMGKLMKIYAQNERGITAPSNVACVFGGDDRMTPTEEAQYNKAVNFYISARDTLGDRKLYPGIWDVVQSQLASTYLIYGLRMQCNQEQDSLKTASEYLQKALKIYEVLGDSHQAAVTHLHLGTLYVKILREQGSSQDKRSTKVAKIHFDKALSFFTAEKPSKEFICTHYEIATMYENIYTQAHSTHFANLVKSIEHLIETSSGFKNGCNLNNTDNTIMTQLVSKVKTKMEEILKQMLKLGISCKNNAQVEHLKQMYRVVLTCGTHDGHQLANVLCSLKQVLATLPR
jgi:tetratricopeptide (TPR) repeat protein